MPEDPAQPEPPVLETPPVVSSKTTRWIALGVVALLLAAVVFVALYEPVANRQFYPQCGFKKLTGLDCPGCGGLRAVHAIAHGQLVEALQFHAGLVLSVPVLVYLFVLWLREWRITGMMPIPLAHESANRPLVWIAVIFISIGALRMIPAKPFSLLATPAVPEEAAK